MSSELADRRLRSFRSKSFFLSSFRHVLNSLSSSFSRLSIFSSFQQSQSDALTSRELLIIIASKCSKTTNNRYVIYHQCHHDVFMQ